MWCLINRSKNSGVVIARSETFSDEAICVFLREVSGLSVELRLPCTTRSSSGAWQAFVAKDKYVSRNDGLL